ncbi:MAG TPA: NAD(P)-dependent oxidoreductase [Candidatus Acidoferrum sp.]|jgi:glutamate synthase (NADPH/NADH) small chain|nr:NAD(P)-dependent oxidoreductase [Candidatus Acidoferrum sp.]
MSDTAPTNLNSKYAWRELAQKGLPKRSGTERAADFLEIYGLYDEATAREQASRCIQCPNPTCVAGCPLCNPIPEWMQLTAEGRFLEAAAVLGSVTNMAEICARVCPSDHLCEGACILESISEPVSIQALEQFLTEYAFAHGQVDASTAPPNGLKVAVVGSGPGGLACAEELAKKGYAVTVFDSALVPGGLLVNGTPAFKLDKSIVQRRIDILQKRGVVFQLGMKLWEDLTLAQLREDFGAVFLGWDSRKARRLEVPGADLKGVVQALPFLLQKTTPIPLDLPPIDVAGKRVVVIGGGDTAMDCLRAAIRYGAREAIGVYRRDQTDMPCSGREYHDAVEEGAKFQFCASPVAVLGNERGGVTGVRLARTEIGLIDDGRPRPFLVRPGTEFELPADWLILALGFEQLPCAHTGDFEPLSVNDWGGLVVDENQMTNLPGVFAGGDLVRGPSLVLHAVRDARHAAVRIHAYLSSSVSSSS